MGIHGSYGIVYCATIKCCLVRIFVGYTDRLDYRYLNVLSMPVVTFEFGYYNQCPALGKPYYS